MAKAKHMKIGSHHKWYLEVLNVQDAFFYLDGVTHLN